MHGGAFARPPAAGPKGPPAGMGLAERVAFLRRQSTAPASTSSPSPYNPAGGYGPYDLPPAGHGYTPLPRLGGSRQPAASVASERPDLESALRAAAGHEFSKQMAPAPDFVMMAAYAGPARPSRTAGAGPDTREAPVRGPVGTIDPSESMREAPPRREQLQVGSPPLRADGGQARAEDGQARDEGGQRIVDITGGAEPPTTAQQAGARPVASAGAERPDRESALRAAAGNNIFEQPWAGR
jgi:hypothetical protein